MAVDNIPRPGLIQLENLDAPRKLGKRETQVYKAAKYDKLIDEAFDSALSFSAVNKDDGTILDNATEPAAGMERVFSTRSTQFEEHVASANSNGTTLWTSPSVSATGMAIPIGVTDVITGRELTNGILDTASAAFTIGTDGPFMLEATIAIADITDLGQLYLGFRKTEAYQVDPASYTDLAAWHVGETGATVADGQFNLVTALNNAAETFVDTTETDWADAASYTLRVTVDKAGRVFWSKNGSAPTVSTTFTFDSGDIVVPFLFLETTSASTSGDPGVVVSAWRVGSVG